MEFDDDIRSKLNSNLPKINLYDGVEYDSLKRQYMATDYNPRDVFVKVLNLSLQYEDTDQLFANNIMTKRMMSFFLNYLQNENLIKGEDLCKKIFFGYINIKSYDDDGNLEYDTLESFQQALILPTYTDEDYNEMMLMIFDLDRWQCLYLNKDTSVGQFLDFKNSGKVEVYENLEVLNQIIQAEFEFEITNFTIKAQLENVNIETDGGFFIINLLYKFIQGVSLDNLTFSQKEKGILKDRIDWLILKIKETQENNDNPKKQKGKFKSDLDGSDDILLDQGVSKRKIQSNNVSRSQIDSRSQRQITNINNESQFSDNDSMLMSKDQKNSRKPTVFVNKGRQKTRILTIKPQSIMESQKDDKSDLQESFDDRSIQDFKQTQGKGEFEDIKQISYQESVNEDLESMWNFGNEKQKPLKKFNEQEHEFEKMWDFKSLYKKNMKQRNNLPGLIPEEHKQYYRERKEQTSQQRDLQDKIVDIVAYLENPDRENQQNPNIEYAVNRLKQILDVKNKGKDIEHDQLIVNNGEIKTKGVADLKKMLKQRLVENATGDLDALLEKQKILNDILDYDLEERNDLEKRFENEIQKIDSRFQQYMQRYDAMNQYESLQSMYKNAYYGPKDNEIAQMKDSMHLELQNYLLSGLGLPGKFSSNPQFANQLQSPNILDSKANSRLPSSGFVPGFNQSVVGQKNQDSQNMKNNSMINLNNRRNTGDSSNSNQISQRDKPIDAITMRYNVTITQKNLIDALTQDRMDENVINFLLGYIQEKYFHENKKEQLIRDENRIFLYPIHFYTELSSNNPLVKQQQLNYNDVSKYTKIYMNKHTIFDEFDKLIIPIKIAKPQYFALCVVDINVRQIIYFPIVKGNSNDKSDISSNSNNSRESNKNISQEIKISDDPKQNPICLNVLKYLEKEYSSKFMKNFQILNWSLSQIPCSQTSSPSLSPYYLLIYIYMIFNQNYQFNKINSDFIKKFKLWMPEVFKTVGLTHNVAGEINFFVSLN